MTPEAESEILELRAKGLTSKQIARKLGLKASQVNSVIKTNAEKTAIAKGKSGELAPIAECLVNTSCVKRLLNNQELEEEDIGGLGMVVIARKTGYKRFVVCSYLIDYWCLGLKDTIGERKMDDVQYRTFLEMIYQGFPEGYQEISLEQAQTIIYGAIDYAAELGLKPHKDFQKTQKHLGTWNDKSKLTFGREGKPFFMSGPYDDTNQIMQTLIKNVGESNFHYTIGL